MISHKYKCIFIHIPGCAGTSMEHLIAGDDWAKIDWKTKHLKSHQAKELYKKYWNSYFKFSFVRNPWDRTISLAKNKRHGVWVNHNSPEINLNKNVEGKWSWLKQSTGFEVFPFDSKKYLKLNSPASNSIYLNYMLEELDFVGKFETLQEDFSYITKTLKIKGDLKKMETSTGRKFHYSRYYNDYQKKIIEQKYEKDLKKFNYSFINTL